MTNTASAALRSFFARTAPVGPVCPIEGRRCTNPRHTAPAVSPTARLLAARPLLAA